MPIKIIVGNELRYLLRIDLLRHERDIGTNMRDARTIKLLCTKVNIEGVKNMSKWRMSATWLMLVIAFAVFLAAVFVVCSVTGRIYALEAIEISIPQIGIICAGVTSVSVIVRCIKQLKSRSELART